jgi:Glycosyltransferase family 87
MRTPIPRPPESASRQTRTVAGFAGFAIVVVVVLVYAWKWHSLAGLTVAIQPVSAASTCVAVDRSPVLFCDFAHHYYLQGQRILATPRPVPGFYYPAPFALLMGAFGALPYNAALTLWVVLGLAFAAGMYLAPQADLFSQSSPATVLHSLLFTSSLPLLHNFVWGQVSVLASLLALVALLAYQKNHRYVAAGVLAVAVAVKLYPALFAIYFLIKRDKQALVAFAAATLVLTFLLSAAFLGIEGTTTYYRVLEILLDQLGHFTAVSPYSNNLANAASILMTGTLAPDGILYQLLHVTGFLLAGCNAILLFSFVRAQKTKPTGRQRCSSPWSRSSSEPRGSTTSSTCRLFRPSCS